MLFIFLFSSLVTGGGGCFGVVGCEYDRVD